MDTREKIKSSSFDYSTYLQCIRFVDYMGLLLLYACYMFTAFYLGALYCWYSVDQVMMQSEGSTNVKTKLKQQVSMKIKKHGRMA